VEEAAQPAAPTRHEHFRVSEYVRWSDIDLAGIICYGAYVRFFEIAESELFRSLGLPFSELFEKLDFWLPRAQLHFEFRTPALLDDRLDLEMWVSKIGTSSLRLEFQARKNNPTRDLTAEAYAVLVAVGRKDLRPIPLPPVLVEALAPFRSDLA
jgi:acyl-CoA thioester hydrolase